MKHLLRLIAFFAGALALAAQPVTTATPFMRQMLMSPGPDSARTLLQTVGTNMPAATIGTLTSTNFSVEVASAGTLTVTDASGLGGTPVDVKWFGAVGDGTTVDYTAIANAVAYCEANARVLFISPGRYRFSNSGHSISVTGRLKVVGAGRNSVLVHDQRDINTAAFTFAGGGPELDVQSLTIEGFAQGVIIPTGHGTIDKIRLVDVTSTNNNYLLRAQQTSTSTQNRVRHINVNFCTHYGVTNVAGALVWFQNVPWDIINIENNQIFGGTEGIQVGPDDFPITLNPVTYCGKVNIRDNFITGIGHATLASRAILVFAPNALIEGNYIKQTHNIVGSSANYFPLYGYLGQGIIRGNTFDRCGDNSGKETILIKGLSLNVNPYDTNSLPAGMSPKYNHPPGWGCLITENVFYDTATAPTGCGKIGFDTDFPRIIRNTWNDPQATVLIPWSPSTTTFDERGGIVCTDNILVRGNSTTFLQVTAAPASAPGAIDGIDFSRNEWHQRTITTSSYMLDVLYSTYNTRIVGNKLWNSTNLSLARFGTPILAPSTHRGVLFTDNYITNGQWGLVLSSTASTNDPGHLLLDATVERNILDQNNGAVLYISSKGQAQRVRMVDNYVTNQYGTVYGQLRLGTAPTYLSDFQYSSNGVMYAYQTDGSWRTKQTVFAVPTPEQVHWTGDAIAAASAHFTSTSGWSLSAGGFAIETGGAGYLQSTSTTTAGYCRRTISEPPMQRPGVLWWYSIAITTNTSGILLQFGSSTDQATFTAGTTGTQTGTVLITSTSADQYLYLRASAASGAIGVDEVQIQPLIATLAAFPVPSGSLASATGQIFKWDANLLAAGDANIDLIWSDGTAFTRVLNGQLLPMSAACNEATLSGSLTWKASATGVLSSRLLAFDNAAGTNIVRGYSYSGLPEVTWASEKGWLLIAATNAADSAVTYMNGSADLKTR